MAEPDDENFEESDDLFEHYRLQADPRQSLLRLDKFLTDRLPNASRNKVQEAIANGFVHVNEANIKSNYKVKPGDVITVSLPHPPRETDILPENIPLNTVYEDDDVLVVNKPAGMVVHPAYNNWTGTLVNALAYHFQNLPTSQNGEARPGLVHRIDKDTSGLMVVAKTEVAMTHLARQFFDHSIERTYWALVWGEPEPAQGTIDVNLGRSLKDRRVTDAFPAGDIGRRAVTHYQVLKPLRYISLVKCNLETGRTHQIRAHMKYLGHPLFNDATYGGDKILKGTVFSKYKAFVENCFQLLPRQALHAKSLGFVHPTTRQWLQFESELPDDFAAALDKWERYVNQHE
ncbi:23S rRNA pseudouridine1911/1915/1917 synthase [Catalinimonas alkaloidigena]|uniref:Pseudouridine synthase n=1 Tax=Catalinimonas alkaloidigena TaxID=1075417 RepID=A0A1G9E0I3_9BACT|nr:RluA family pseudouridine synthase [Catalinimonas alkaloidigena]SDK69624.1 23S rRNA pseudouridine1911/1915/1917 synthase [Catalinimonas alkaloidigena]